MKALGNPIYVRSKVDVADDFALYCYAGKRYPVIDRLDEGFLILCEMTADGCDNMIIPYDDLDFVFIYLVEAR